MIGLKFGLFWSGAPLSYLRYLTFKSLRHYHPNAEIELYVSNISKTDGFKWGAEKQDFQENQEAKCYLEALEDLDIDVTYMDLFEKYQPNFQSDFFRWWWLKTNSGFYLDTDQIVLKPFDSLPLESDFIFSAYQAQSCGLYSPVGVIGASKDAEIVDWINKLLPQFYEPNNYNSLGPFMLRTMLGMRKWKGTMFNAPSQYFYPVPDSFMVPSIYDGSVVIPDDSITLHWFGGHPASQEFNKHFNEAFALTSNDSISKRLREEGIIAEKSE